MHYFIFHFSLRISVFILSNIFLAKRDVFRFMVDIQVNRKMSRFSSENLLNIKENKAHVSEKKKQGKIGIHFKTIEPHQKQNGVFIQFRKEFKEK